MSDLRQRFFIEDSPVRGEIVHLEEALQTILAQRDYAPAYSGPFGRNAQCHRFAGQYLKN